MHHCTRRQLPSVRGSLPVCCRTERGCWGTWPSRTPPSDAALSQRAVKTWHQHKGHTHCGASAAAASVWVWKRRRWPWSPSSPAEQKQTGWGEKPPGPLSQLATVCPQRAPPPWPVWRWTNTSRSGRCWKEDERDRPQTPGKSFL